MTTLAAEPVGLRFDPEAHEYRFDGEVVPSVTQVLAPIVDYSAVPAFMLNYAADRGTQAHYACELYDADELDEESLDERLVPYVEAWKAFRAESGFTIEHSEQRLYHPRYRYAGTCDRVGILNGRRTVLEIKTTATLLPATAVQCAAYQAAFNETAPAAMRAKGCVAVHLRPDGSYRLERYEDTREHFAAFVALLTLKNWRAKYE
jgi:hypothetical protein